MRKTGLLMGMILAALLMAGCAKAPARAPQEVAGEYVQKQSAPSAAAAEGADQAQPVGAPAVPVAQQPDIDLKDASYPVAFAQVYEIARDPKRYMGKTLRIQGVYYAVEQVETGEVVHLILVTDQAGCCEVALEFMRAGASSWPEDYPPNDSAILLHGVLDTISAGGTIYPLLMVNDIQQVQLPAP